MADSTTNHAMLAIRQLDLVLLAVALPLFIALGLPLLGWGTGAGAWLLQKGLQTYLARKARASDDPRTVVGLTAGGMIARGWLVALVILGVGLHHNSAGLAAAVLVMILFTAYFTVGMLMRPFQQAKGAHR
jgi:hypothetical protein